MIPFEIFPRKQGNQGAPIHQFLDFTASVNRSFLWLTWCSSFLVSNHLFTPIFPTNGYMVMAAFWVPILVHSHSLMLCQINFSEISTVKYNAVFTYFCWWNFSMATSHFFRAYKSFSWCYFICAVSNISYFSLKLYLLESRSF